MATQTIDRSKQLTAYVGPPVPYAGDLEMFLAAAQLDGRGSLLKPGEYLVTAKFLDHRITAGKEYEVRAIGQPRYARFTGQLTRIRPGYGWVLTFEDAKYIASDGSFVPVSKGILRAVFPREDDFTIYADGAPLGYGLIGVRSSIATGERGGFHDIGSIDPIHTLAGCFRRQPAHHKGAGPLEVPGDTAILTEQGNGFQRI